MSQSSGRVPVLTDFWNIRVSPSASCVEHSLRTRLWMLSGPAAFAGFIFLSSFSTPFSVMLRFFITGYWYREKLWVVEDLVNTDLNCSARMFALPVLSLTSLPFAFSGATAILSDPGFWRALYSPVHIFTVLSNQLSMTPDHIYWNISKMTPPKNARKPSVLWHCLLTEGNKKVTRGWVWRMGVQLNMIAG